LNDQPITRQELTEAKRLQWAAWGISVLLVVAGTFLGVRFPDLPPIPADPGDVASRGGFYSNFAGLVVAVPTTAATATPGIIVNNLGLGKAIEVQDAGTPVWSIHNGGSVSRTGNDSITGDVSITGAGKVAAATAVATATPALVVDSLGAANNLLEVRDAATPVFTVNNGGTVVGNVLQYGSSGEKAVAATASITTTGTVAHGLATVSWAVCTLAQDPHTDAGDAATVSVSIAANTVTAKAWQDDATASTETEVDVYCLVIGTP
jgi:hypothetical protein